MGLDQHWFSREPDAVDGEEDIEIMYHRKVPALEFFMAHEWRNQGNTGTFNCEYLPITPDILDRLEANCNTKALNPEASGFFWGVHDDCDYPEILRAITKARETLAEGKLVFYSSWW